MARLHGLTVAAVVWALCAAVWPRFVHASSNPSYDGAMATCESYMQSQQYRDNFVTSPSAQYYINKHCGVGPSQDAGCPTSQYVCMLYTDTRNPSYKASSGGWAFTGLPPNPCEDLPLKTFQGGLTSVCVSGCSYAPAPDLGGTSHQRINMDGSISEVFGGTYRSTGAECSGGPNANPPVSDPTPERKLCGGGSCHDVAAGKFCAVNGAGRSNVTSGNSAPGATFCARRVGNRSLAVSCV